MGTEEQLGRVKRMLLDLLEAEPSYFLVQFKVKPTNNIKVFIDGDNGVTIDAVSRLNRSLYRQIEESGIFPDDDFSLEVSSAGVGEPLLQYRQYVKNKGRYVEVVLTEGGELEGELKEVEEAAITLETVTGKGKKMETKQHVIPFENIKTTTVQIKF